MNTGCLRVVAYGLIVLGALLGLLGLVFLLAPDRAAKGLVMLGIAAVLIGLAVGKLRAMARLAPEYLEQQLAALAAANDGELTLAAACGHLRLDADRVAPALQALAARGAAQVEAREGVERYVFPGLKQAKMVKKCPYCGNEYPVNTPGRTCPSCGGNLEVGAD